MNEKPIYIGICAIIRNKENKILIENHVKLQGLSLPGGKCERGEGPLYAILRELREELGIDVATAYQIDRHYFPDIPYPKKDNKFADFDEYLFKVEAYNGKIENKEPKKHTELLWLSREELEERNDLSDILADYLKRGLI